MSFRAVFTSFSVLVILNVSTMYFVILPRLPVTCPSLLPPPPIILRANITHTPQQKQSNNNCSYVGTTYEGDDMHALLPITFRYSLEERNNMYRASKTIEGWSGELTFDMVSIVSDEQRRYNVTSRSVGEVGVHQGKSFVWMDALSFVHEHVFALDVFDMQHLNSDHSGGRGLSVDSFWRNIGPIVSSKGRAHIEVIRASSLTTTACNLSDRHLTPVRLFSIDGSHTGEATYSDCCLAAATLTRGGCMFVDDYLNHGWLGVHEGVHRFLYERRTQYAPLAIAAGKFWICDAMYVQLYRSALLSRLPAVLVVRSRELNRSMKLVTQSRMYGIQMIFIVNS